MKLSCYNCGCPVPDQHLKTVDGDIQCDECYDDAEVVRESFRIVPTCWNCTHSFGSPGRTRTQQYCDRGHHTITNPDNVCDLHQSYKVG